MTIHYKNNIERCWNLFTRVVREERHSFHFFTVVKLALQVFWILSSVSTVFLFNTNRSGCPPHCPHLPSTSQPHPQMSLHLRSYRKETRNPISSFPRKTLLPSTQQKPVVIHQPAALQTVATFSSITLMPLRLSLAKCTSPMTLLLRRAVAVRKETPIPPKHSMQQMTICLSLPMVSWVAKVRLLQFQKQLNQPRRLEFVPRFFHQLRASQKHLKKKFVKTKKETWPSFSPRTQCTRRFQAFQSSPSAILTKQKPLETWLLTPAP